MLCHGILPVDTPVLGYQKKIYIHQLCENIGYNVDDLQRSIADRDGWREKVKWQALMRMIIIRDFNLKYLLKNINNGISNQLKAITF